MDSRGRVRGERGHVVRIKQPGRYTLGWQARIPYRKAPRRYRSRLFSDQMYGGSYAAYLEARQWLARRS